MPTTTGVLTNYTEAKILDHMVNLTTWSVPNPAYLGLLIATPTDTGGTEVTTAGTNGYARISCASKFAAASSRSIASNAEFLFGPSTGGPWSTVAYWGLFDAATAGNLLAYGDITDGSVGTNDSYRITSGNISFTWTSTATTKWTDAVCNAWLEHLVGRTDYGASAEAYLALFEGDPLGAGAESHTAGTGGYARQSMSGKMSAASGGSITNGTAVFSYGPATASWGVVDYYAIYTAATAGTLLGGGPLDASKTVNTDDSAEYATSTFTLTMD